jgi:hypothetical protein
MKFHHLLRIAMIVLLIILEIHTKVVIFWLAAIALAIGPLFYNADNGEEEF